MFVFYTTDSKQVCVSWIALKSVSWTNQYWACNEGKISC